MIFLLPFYKTLINWLRVWRDEERFMKEANEFFFIASHSILITKWYVACVNILIEYIDSTILTWYFFATYAPLGQNLIALIFPISIKSQMKQDCPLIPKGSSCP